MNLHLNIISLPEIQFPLFSGFKKEQAEIIHFSILKEKRLLNLTGNHHSIKMDLVVKAIRYSAERNHLNFAGGVRCIDLEHIRTIEQILSLVIQRCNIQPRVLEPCAIFEWFRIKSNNGKPFLLVFIQYSKLNQELKIKVNQFLRDLGQYGGLTKVIVESDDPIELGSNFTVVNLSKLNAK